MCTRNFGSRKMFENKHKYIGLRLEFTSDGISVRLLTLIRTAVRNDLLTTVL